MKRYIFTYNNYLPKTGEIQVMADSQDEAFRLAYDDLIDTFTELAEVSLDIGNGWKIPAQHSELGNRE